MRNIHFGSEELEFNAMHACASCAAMHTSPMDVTLDGMSTDVRAEHP